MTRRSCSDCGCKMSRVTKKGRPNKIGLRTNGVNMHYMLKTALWFEINQAYRGFLCLTCAQIRLGRKFVPTDFKPVPINFAKGGALATLFPDEFTAHMVAFVGKETVEEQDEARRLIDAHYKSLESKNTTPSKEEVAVDLTPEENNSETETETKPKSKGKSKKKTTTSKKTKKAMNDLKKNKRVFTNAIYGWDVKDRKLYPNWDEQNNIDWMKKQLGFGMPAAEIAKTLNINDCRGKRGGKWNSSGVLRTVKYDIHADRDESEAPRWFRKRSGNRIR